MKKLLIAVLLVALAAPAFAFQIALPGEGNSLNLYGQVRMQAWYQGVNNFQGSKATTTEDFVYGIQSNSRVGFDLNVGKFFGKLETNFNGDGETTGNFGFRLLYGGYKFDHGGTLTIGRMFILGETSLAFDALYDTDGGMAGFGTILSYRRAGIKYGIAGFELAVFQTSGYGAAYGTTDKPVTSDVTANVDGTKRTISVNSVMAITDYYPEVQAAYNAKFGDMMTGKVFVTWAGFDMQNTINVAGIINNATQKEMVNQVTAGLVLKPKLGPVGISFSAIYAYNGQLMNRVRNGKTSIGAWAAFDEVPVTAGSASIADKWVGIFATHTYGLALEATYAINDMFSARIGGGWQSTSSEGLQEMQLVDGKKVKTLDSFAVYVNAPVKLNQYLIIIPTVGYFAESRSNGNFKGTGNLIAGAQLRVIF